MLVIESINKTFLVFICILFFLISVGIVISMQIQNKQSKKYKECLRLIKEKEDGTLNNNLGIDLNEIKNISPNVDVNKLQEKLYNIYLEFVQKLSTNDESISFVLDEFINDVYQNKLEIYKSKNTNEITENIELVNYSILKYEKEKIEFRINITCTNYKKANDTIISGSMYDRLEQIFIVTFVKQRKRWVINNIEKVYEKKLSI